MKTLKVLITIFFVSTSTTVMANEWNETANASGTFESCGTGYYCYQEYGDAELDAEDAAVLNADHQCNSGEAVRSSGWRTRKSSQNCSVTKCADFKCKR